MFRTAVLAFALAAAPAVASAQYRAEPAAKPAATKFVLRDTVWKCGDAGCAAAESNSRPAIVCARLAREVGTLLSFSAGGKPLNPEELEKCNARAR
jgi:hypothetical protein